MRPDQQLAEIAVRQYGVVSRAQALAAGLGPDAINRRLSSGRLVRLHAGIYALPGIPASWHQTLMAAVLWAGPGSAASHRSAGHLWRLDGDFEQLEITSRRRLVSDIVLAHKSGPLPPHDMKVIEGITVTGVERTLVDLAGVLEADALEDALDSALRRRVTSVARLKLWIRQAPRRRGIAALKCLLLERSADGQPTESRFETRLHRLLVKAGLPPLKQQTIWDGGEFVARVDFCYPEAKVIVEADSYRWHSSKRAWQRDIERRNQLTALGWQIVHITWDDLVRRPAATVSRLRCLMQPTLFGAASG